jgi:phosphoribosylformylglycinamidine synthase
LMSWGFDPFISEHSPYHGAIFAVVESVAKIIAAGGTRGNCWLTFQEYFERLHDDPVRWGKPAAALLGALTAQMELGVAAIGGKDSMSGSFEDLDVPPTLISFAVSVADAHRVVSSDFKTQAGGYVYLLAPDYRYRSPLPEYISLRRVFDTAEELISRGKVVSARALGTGGTAMAVPLMCFGSRVGFRAEMPLSEKPMAGAILLGSPAPIPELSGCLLGRTTEDYTLTLHGGESLALNALEEAWLNVLEPVFPMNTDGQDSEACAPVEYTTAEHKSPAIKVAKPKVLIPVFPGTNCEDAMAHAFMQAGAEAEIFIVRNLTANDVEESVAAFLKPLRESQIIALPGGVPAFAEAFFRRAAVTEAVRELLRNRDGLMLGVGDGFSALVNLGLLPYGDIRGIGEDDCALAPNLIGRHQAGIMRTRVASNLSPWLSATQVGDVFTVPVSTAEGRFTASASLLDELVGNGQIAAQYVDENCTATQDIRYNPTGSVLAVEAITSPDGRILGKTGHSERYGENLYRNVPHAAHMDIFSGAVGYWA